MTQLATALFVVRRNMDFDNLLPVAWRIAREPGWRVIMLSMGPDLRIEADPRARWIGRHADFECGDLFEAWQPWAGYRIYSALSKRTRLDDNGRPAGLYGRFLAWSRSRLFGSGWCEGLLCDLGVKALVMDWAKRCTGMTGLLTDTARRLGILSFSLPHGVDKCVDEKYYSILSEIDFGHFDYIVTPNFIRRDFVVRYGFPTDRIAVLGSARFCEEWEDVCRHIEPGPPTATSAENAKLKVLYFDPVLEPDGLFDTLRSVAALEFVELTIMPKPWQIRRYKTAAWPDFGANVTVAKDASSFGLALWADVVIGTQTGILIEALVQGTDLVYLKHLDRMVPLYETMEACWVANSPDDVADILRRIHAEPGRRPFHAAAARRFVSEVVHGGVTGDILDGYAQFIFSRLAGTGARSTREGTMVS